MLTQLLAKLTAPRNTVAKRRATAQRRLAVESLEARQLLSADGLTWQNHFTPTDVNHDGAVTIVDAFAVVSELRQHGAHALDAVQPLARAGAESAAAPSNFMYLDVNGDNYVTPVDALLVVRHIRNGADPGDVMEFSLDTTALDGSPLTGPIMVGDTFRLNVYVQDVRPGYAPAGVYIAYVDVTYDSARVAAGTLTHGADYDDSDLSGSAATPGLIDEAGGANLQLTSLGADKLLLFSTTFTASIAGDVTFATNPADLAGHEVAMFDPPSDVATSLISYETTTITIVEGLVVALNDTFAVEQDTADNVLDVLANDRINTTGGTPAITVDTTDLLGTLTQNGTELRYTPPTGFTGTETFTYVLSDGLGNSDGATVTINVNPINHAPVAVDDGGAGFSIKKNATVTTASVLTNDTDSDGDTLTVLSVNTAGTLGLVTNNNDGTFTYNPNGQFNALADGEQATDTFQYTVSDGKGGTDTAIVTITVVGAPDQPGQVSGVVYADVDHDGQRDPGERAIGGVQIQLVGADLFGTPVDLTVTTDAQGQYAFADLTAGNYLLREIGPKFFIDGIDSLDGAIFNTNDTVVITPNMNLADLRVDFGEWSLEPAYIHISDFLNTANRQGIVVGFDPSGHMLWYSLLDGWDGVTDIDCTLAPNGADVVVTVWKGDTGMTFAVPLSSIQGKSILKGATNDGRVYQFLGTWGGYQPSATVVQAAFAQIGEGTF